MLLKERAGPPKPAANGGAAGDAGGMQDVLKALSQVGVAGLGVSTLLLCYTRWLHSNLALTVFPPLLLVRMRVCRRRRHRALP
jgi:hypothetical protein